LKFNRSFEKRIGQGSRVTMAQAGIVQAGIVKQDSPLLRRFLAKLVIDVMPAALTSVIGGVLITQYQFQHAVPPRPVTEQAAPATAEMVQLVRDEHAAVMDYLKAQIAAEKSRNAAADAADAHAAAAAKDGAEAPVVAPTRVVPGLTLTPKGDASRNKPVVAVSLPPHDPLAIAQAVSAASAPAVLPAQRPKSLLASTLDIKDHVVGATLHVVSAIGGIPSWIASIGDRGGVDKTPDAAGRSFSS
jgi:hypothetical protein